jgi:hypothetical protein
MKRKVVPLTAITAAVAIAGPAWAVSTPAVSTSAATSVTQTTAVLNGKINPEGSATKYYFRWGPTTLYGATSGTHSLSAGTSTVSVHVTAGRLVPGTVYHFQLIASNGGGQTIGKDRTFKTAGHAPPNPITGPATVTGKTSVVVTGIVNTEGQSTQWFFRYGLSTKYGASVVGGTVAASKKPVSVSQTINGLAQGTTFHYELVAFHAGSVQRVGGDQTFTTFPIKRVRPGFHAKITPHRARTKPFLFTVSGSVKPPGFPPGLAGCSGTVLIHFMAGRRVVASVLPAVQANCKWAVQVQFSHLIKHKSRKLRVWIHFRGNNYLAPRTVRKKVRLG